MEKTVPRQIKSDVFASVTAKIVAALEKGAAEFTLPWHGGVVPPLFPVNAATQKPYRGINVVVLWAEAAEAHFLSGHWASYRQWQSLGAQVRKGEHGATVVFYKPIAPTEGKEDGDESVRFVARAARVFNAEQVEGWSPPLVAAKPAIAVHDTVATFLRAIGVEVQHHSGGARYRADLDRIDMPHPHLFIGTASSTAEESYHGVLCHETVHWSGAPHRLNRQFGSRFGDQAYAFEELIAELGAAFLCSAFRLVNEPRADHAAYLQSWLKVLRADKKAIFAAASKAQEAVAFLIELASAHLAA